MGSDAIGALRHVRYPAGRKAFTLFEILIASMVMAVGAGSIFRIFFGVINASGYISARFEADRIIDAKIWDAKALVREKNIIGTYSESDSTGKRPVFESAVSLERLGPLSGLYKLDVTVSWKDGAKGASCGRSMYIRQVR